MSTHRVIRPHEVSGLILGKIGIKVDPITGYSIPMVYQRVGRGRGNIKNIGKRDLQLRREPPREDAQSDAQMMLRRRMAAAVQAYQALNDIERAAYKAKARERRQTGYNLFIAEFCEAHPVEEFIEDRVTLEFYGDAGAIARPFSVLKFYILER